MLARVGIIGSCTEETTSSTRAPEGSFSTNGDLRARLADRRSTCRSSSPPVRAHPHTLSRLRRAHADFPPSRGCRPIRSAPPRPRLHRRPEASPRTPPTSARIDRFPFRSILIPTSRFSLAPGARSRTFTSLGARSRRFLGSSSNTTGPAPCAGYFFGIESLRNVDR